MNYGKTEGRIATYLITSDSIDTGTDTDSNSDTDTDSDDDEEDDDVIIIESTITYTYDYDTAEELAQMINDYREENDLSAITISETLTEYAMIRAEECDTLYSHTRPDGTMITDISGIYAEIVSSGFTIDQAFESWQESSEHNEIMLSASNSKTTMGVGVVEVLYESEYTSYTYYVTVALLGTI